MVSLGVNIPCVKSSFVVCRKNETQNEGSNRCIGMLNEGSNRCIGMLNEGSNRCIGMLISCSCGVILCK